MDGFFSRDAHFQGKHLDICLFVSKQGGVGLQEVVCGWLCSAGEASAVPRCDSPTETAQLFCPYSLQRFKEYTACVEGGCGNSCVEFGFGSSLQHPTVLGEKPGANSSLSNLAIVLCYSSAPEIFIN